MFLWETLIIPTMGCIYLWIFFLNVYLYTTSLPGHLEIRRGCQLLWNQSFRWFLSSCRFWEWDSGLLEELLSTKPFLHPCILSVMQIFQLNTFVSCSWLNGWSQILWLKADLVSDSFESQKSGTGWSRHASFRDFLDSQEVHDCVAFL